MGLNLFLRTAWKFYIHQTLYSRNILTHRRWTLTFWAHGGWRYFVFPSRAPMAYGWGFLAYRRGAIAPGGVLTHYMRGKSTFSCKDLGYFRIFKGGFFCFFKTGLEKKESIINHEIQNIKRPSTPKPIIKASIPILQIILCFFFILTVGQKETYKHKATVETMP